VGSTYTGMMLLELMQGGNGPAAMVVQKADSLLVSGSILAAVWADCGVPIVEFSGDDLFDVLRTGDWVNVEGDKGEVVIR